MRRAQSSPAQSSPAQSSPARPNPAHPTPIHPSLPGLGAVTAVLAIGLFGLVLLVVLLGGCSNSQEPAPTTSPTTAPSGSATSAQSVPPLPLPQPVPPGGPAAPEPGLGPQDRALLAQARREQAPWVILLVEPAPNQAAEATRQLEQLGGVLGVSPGNGYLRLTMPTGNVEQAAELPTIAAVDVEQVVPPANPRPPTQPTS